MIVIDRMELIQYAAMTGQSVARVQWKKYYRAVREIRRIRALDPMMFLRFSRAWWAGSYKDEQFSAVGLYASMGHTVRPLQRRRLP